MKSGTDKYVADTVTAYSSYIETAIKVPWRTTAAKMPGRVLADKSQELRGANIKLIISDGFTDDWPVKAPKKAGALEKPAAPWVV